LPIANEKGLRALREGPSAAHLLVSPRPGEAPAGRESKLVDGGLLDNDVRYASGG